MRGSNVLLGEANAMTAAVHLHSVPRLRDGRRARITIVYALAFTSWFYLLPYPQFQVFAQEPACDVHVPLPSAVEEIGGLATFHDAPNGLLLFTGGSVFRYDGSTAVQIPSPNYTTGPEGDTLFDTSYGILLQGENGMFRYDGNGIVPVPGQWLGSIFAIQNTPGGTFIGSENGLFLYDGTRIARVHGQSTGRVLGLYFKSGRLFAVAQNGFFQFNDSEVVQLPGDSVESFGGFHDTPLGLLLLANKGLYFYNGKTFARVPGDTIDLVRGLHDLPGGLLVAGLHDLFRYDGLRVTRVPGDTIELRDEALYMNGRKLDYTVAPGHPFGREIYEDDEPVVAREAGGGHDHWVMLLPSRSARRSFAPLVVPAGEYFMMGDSRDNSFDSRYFGLVDREQIVGRASRVLVSLDKNRHYLPRLSRSLALLDE